MTRKPTGQLYRPSITLITRPEPGILLATSPLWDCGSYDTAGQLSAELDKFTVDTPFRCELLNKLRDSFRARQQAIGHGTAAHPLWDSQRGEWGPNGFRLAYGLLGKCAARVGLLKCSFGYRMPVAGK